MAPRCVIRSRVREKPGGARTCEWTPHGDGTRERELQRKIRTVRRRVGLGHKRASAEQLAVLVTELELSRSDTRELACVIGDLRLKQQQQQTDSRCR